MASSQLLCVLVLCALLLAPSSALTNLSFNACRTSGQVALTIDDGPWVYENTTVDILAKYNAKATYFMVGKHSSNRFGCIYNESQSAALVRTFKAGHQIGSLTWSHLDLTTISDSKIESEMHSLDLALQRIIGVVPRFMRPAYGNVTQHVMDVLTKRGNIVVGWNSAPGDTTRTLTDARRRERIRQFVARYPEPQISLLHESEEGSMIAGGLLEYSLQQYQKAGYSFVTLAECHGGDAYLSTNKPRTRTSVWHC